MFVYEKALQYPVRIKNTNPKLASLIISQFGGPYCSERRFSHTKTTAPLGKRLFYASYSSSFHIASPSKRAPK